MLEIKPNDLIALEALWSAISACNAADTDHLWYQFRGTWGLGQDAFMDAATVIFNEETARRVFDMLCENGENVAYQLEYLARNDMCSTCGGFLDTDHCEDSECQACPGAEHIQTCFELECLGHESTDGPIGISVYCNASCRPRVYTPATR